MRILIPMIVIPLIVLLLYLFVPGLKEQHSSALTKNDPPSLAKSDPR
jgi:competence protein ComGC